MPSSVDEPGAQRFLPADRRLSSLKQGASDCRGCALFEDATQTVFGNGKPDAGLMLVGEQPGDCEDQQGLPFVGPAGSLLTQALHDAEIDPTLTYQTNAVKHFVSISNGWASGEYTPSRAAWKLSRVSRG